MVPDHAERKFGVFELRACNTVVVAVAVVVVVVVVVVVFVFVSSILNFVRVVGMSRGGGEVGEVSSVLF